MAARECAGAFATELRGSLDDIAARLRDDRQSVDVQLVALHKDVSSMQVLLNGIAEKVAMFTPMISIPMVSAHTCLSNAATVAQPSGSANGDLDIGVASTGSPKTDSMLAQDAMAESPVCSVDLSSACSDQQCSLDPPSSSVAVDLEHVDVQTECAESIIASTEDAFEHENWIGPFEAPCIPLGRDTASQFQSNDEPMNCNPGMASEGVCAAPVAWSESDADSNAHCWTASRAIAHGGAGQSRTGEHPGKEKSRKSRNSSPETGATARPCGSPGASNYKAARQCGKGKGSVAASSLSVAGFAVGSAWRTRPPGKRGGKLALPTDIRGVGYGGGKDPSRARFCIPFARDGKCECNQQQSQIWHFGMDFFKGFDACPAFDHV